MGSISNNLRTSSKMMNNIWFVLHLPRVRIELISWILQNVYLRYYSFHSIKQIVRFSSSEIKKMCNLPLHSNYMPILGILAILFPDIHLHLEISFYFYATSIFDFIGGYIFYVSLSTPSKHLWITIADLMYYEIHI